MAVVTQNESPLIDYSPFEGMAEARRLWSSAPRGIIRFDLEVGLDAKPVNDSIDLQITCSLPSGFAYVLSTMSLEVLVDTASDWDDFCIARVFNGLPNGTVSNQQFATFAMALVTNKVANDPRRVLHYQLGTLRDWWPNPIVKSPGATGHSLILDYHNAAAAVGAAGSLFFHVAVYQYELNQAVRFPLNSPLPVGTR